MRLCLHFALAGMMCFQARAAAETVSTPDVNWKPLQPGLEYAVIDLNTWVDAGDNKLQVVRVDPENVRFKAVLAREHGKERLTAGQWCKKLDLAAAINLGMFQTDGLTHVGYMRNAGHLNSSRWNGYMSALAFNPKKNGIPKAVLVDLDEAGAREKLNDYETSIQNLRLIRHPGKNVWQEQQKRWSEAAVAMDNNGRILFLFCRTPFPMYEFNRIVLSLPLGIERAMHVEGGPEASLSIHAGGVDIDLSGSYETGFNEGNGNRTQWPIPNVLGVVKTEETKP